MNKIFEWLFFNKILTNKIENKKLVEIDNVYEYSKENCKNIYRNCKKNNINKRSINIEVQGEPKIKRNNLTPRSTPIVLDIDLGLTNKQKDSRRMIVEWELTEDEVRNEKNISSIDFNIEKYVQNEKSRIFDNDLSVAYLSRHKRIYTDNIMDIKEKIYDFKDEKFDSIENNVFNTNKRFKNMRKLELGDCMSYNTKNIDSKI